MMKHQQDNIKDDDNNNHPNLLMRNAHGNIFDDIPDQKYVGFHYFSLLSAENFSVIENICFPFYKIGHVYNPPRVVGNCDGLLCLHFTDHRFALWNPSKKEIKFLQSTIPLPPPPVPLRCNDCSFGITSFGPTGFGFDSKSEDYKVVRFVTQYYQNEFGGSCSCEQIQVQLYSLKSDSWKEIPYPEETINVDDDSFFNNYINGFCYWIASGEYDTVFILSFDFANEKFSTIPLPDFDESLTHDYELWELVDYNGSLGFLFYPNNYHKKEGTEKFFDLWVMNNGTWTREFYIQSVSRLGNPLGFWKNGELFLESSNNELLLFDPATQEIKNNLGILAYDYSPQDFCSFGQMQLATYVESLVPINGRSEHEENIIRQPPVKGHQNDILSSKRNLIK